MMHAGHLALLLTIVLETSPIPGETPRNSSTSSLPRALAVFAATDADHDGRVSPEEAKAIPVSTAVFAAEDENGDGFWSRDEFLIFYRHQLTAGGQPVGADLEAEIARLQALKRVRVVEQTNSLTAETSARCANAASISERFEGALADLEKKCSARKATRDDFQRLRNLVILNGRAADRSGVAGQAGVEGRSPTSQTAMLETLDKIEKGAALGQPTKDGFQTLRGLAGEVARARAAVGGSSLEADRVPSLEAAKSPSPAGSPSVAAKPAAVTGPTGPADARQRALLPKIESKPERSSPPIPTPAPPPSRDPKEKEKPDRQRP